MKFQLILSALVALASHEASAQLDYLRGAIPRYESGSCTYDAIMSSCGTRTLTWTSNGTGVTFQNYCTATVCYLVCQSQFPALRIDDCLDDVILEAVKFTGATGTDDISSCVNSVCCDCFSGDCTVEVEGQPEPVFMKDVKVGDKVLTANNKYEPIYAFSHKDVDSLGSYISITTSKKDHSLEISKNHLVYLKGSSDPVRARDVKVGDELDLKDGTSATITDLKVITKTGLFGPLTPDGTIVVNGIKASNYIGLQDHAPEYMEILETLGISHHMANHLWFSPLRIMCMAVSEKTCESYTQGFHTWSSVGMAVVGTTDTFPAFLRPFGIMAVIGFVLVSIVLEYMINSPVVVVAGAGVAMAMKYGRKQKKAKTA